MKKSSLLLLCIAVLFSCSKQDSASVAPISGTVSETGKATQTRSADNMPPVVVFAIILPPKPVVTSPLTVQFNGRDPENDLITYNFRWYADNQLVQDGPLGDLAPGKYRKGSMVYAEVIPSDAHGAGKTFKIDTITILNSPPAISSVNISPQEIRSGIIISAIPAGSDPDGDEVRYQYQWYVNGKVVSESQESNEFNTKGMKKRDTVGVMVTAFDRDIPGVPIGSLVLTLPNTAPQITSLPKYDIVNGLYSYQVAAKDADGDKLAFSLVAAPSGMTINSSTGLIQWKVPTQVSGPQDVPIKIEVDDNDGGKAVQEFSITLEMK